ncbi:thylakoid lumenal 29 kDa protein, chloroplastic-like isoform X2 [Solanum stenotomum]|uniref:thylakoid lumenal 29 kDa protein, chloroplastic-like isoform X2 n=1 Tax=Solanum stenotomum TaxID=172797 RepID=UPI0020D0E63D|nr:thylakoid lumenal 29 kDa protein, chloroplastic-like isoform X2 [Solanum stenotomum]
MGERSEINRPENKGIASALNLLEESKKVIDSNFKGGPISYADLHQFAELQHESELSIMTCAGESSFYRKGHCFKTIMNDIDQGGI